MAWNNGPLTVYHGCDDQSAQKIATRSPSRNHSVSLQHCKLLTDFGKGFYTTTNLHQARQWALDRVKRLRKPASTAAVVQFDTGREALAKLDSTTFVWEGYAHSSPQSDYWDLVQHCRSGNNHLRAKTPQCFYDVVYGPVSLWTQKLVMKDCDQISFHTGKSLDVLGIDGVAII